MSPRILQVNRRYFLLGGGAALALGRRARASRRGGIPAGAGSSPFSLPLADSGNLSISYLGQFTATQSNGDFQFTGGALSLSSDGKTLYLNGSGSAASMGAVTVPNSPFTGQMATRVIAPTAISSGSNDIATGSLIYGGKAYITSAVSYDATGSQTVFMTPMNANFTGQGTPCGANGSAGSYNRLFSNGMNVLPALWQPYFGGPAYIQGGPGGESGLSIISKQCCGYGFSTFDPTSVVAGSPVGITEWLNYPYNDQGTGNSNHISVLWGSSFPNQFNTQSNWGGEQVSNYATIYDRPLGCAFIPTGSRSLLFLHCHSYGPHLGAGTSPCDHNGTASGSNETPISPDTQTYIRIQVSAYDLNDIYINRTAHPAVDPYGNPLNGNVYDPRPYAWWHATAVESALGISSTPFCPVNGSWRCQAWATYDFNAQADGTHRLYVHEGFDGIIHVFNVGHL